MISIKHPPATVSGTSVQSPVSSTSALPGILLSQGYDRSVLVETVKKGIILPGEVIDCAVHVY